MSNRFSLKRKLHYTQSKRTIYPKDLISDISALLKLSADALESVSLALVFPVFLFDFYVLLSSLSPSRSITTAESKTCLQRDTFSAKFCAIVVDAMGSCCSIGSPRNEVS